jgi:hypothetical protein
MQETAAESGGVHRYRSAIEGRTTMSDRPVDTVERAGESALPSAYPSSLSRGARLSRRSFLVAGGAFAALALTTCGGGGGGGSDDGPVQVFALSGRGRRISNAAKSHNANKRFQFAWVAETERAHAGDTSFVVPLTVSASEFRRLFGGGNLVADLRHL